ncbi:hypothetical protein GCM10009765_23960 [Fodinicola feengrottensis]|uniref:Uncharacterized protein n=1 Tax=Fodinicola feengrottensis TaxID=435914 RepID=A0ABN2GMY0_9ACTN
MTGTPAEPPGRGFMRYDNAPTSRRHGYHSAGCTDRDIGVLPPEPPSYPVDETHGACQVSPSAIAITGLERAADALHIGRIPPQPPFSRKRSTRREITGGLSRMTREALADLPRTLAQLSCIHHLSERRLANGVSSSETCCGVAELNRRQGSNLIRSVGRRWSRH